MTLDTLPPRRPDRVSDGTDASARASQVRRVGAVRDRHEARHGLPSRSLLVALVLGCAALMVVDKTGGEDSPVEPARRLAGEVLGPAQAGVSAFLEPVLGIPGALDTNDSLRDRVAALEDENAELLSALRTAGYDEHRLQQLDGLRTVAGDTGYAMVPARVVAIGPAQTFSNTVTIDAGSDGGLHPDMTVLAAAGLVGRVTSVTSHTAVVRLIADSGSTVGGRIGENMEMGLVHGRGRIGDDAVLDLQMVDASVVPEQGQTVVTAGSQDGGPYVSGVPIGEVTRVFEEIRAGTYRAEVRPFVDLTALDMVGVVVPSGTQTNRPVIEADGNLRMPS
ncbi:MAG TPA: rod shape-determining protein MreC [Nocardioides sp.]|nr:rod shape-determining protein MreC [Nocardioides sp.]